MIGDWVYFKTNKVYAKITEIYFTLDVEHKYMVSLNSCGNRYCVSINEIEPIPITKEILEKNGFKKEIGAKEVVFTYDDDDKNYRLVIHPKETNYCGIYTYIHIDVGCVGIEELPLEYVHQLQHALRLCGIEKEITL